MNSNELDSLLVRNESRIEAIKARFFEKKENIKTYKEVLVESKENFETKQRYKDNSLAYPTYGRGLDPHRDMNTFMVQENMAGSPDRAKKLAAGIDLSPQASVQAKQRRKILSPKRQRFENNFERFMNTKYVENPIKEIPEKEAEAEMPPPMDFYSKPTGSKNTQVLKREEQIAKQKAKKAASKINRPLTAIEKEAELLINSETVINLENNWVENFRRVYVKSKARGEEHLEDVIKEEFFTALVEDDYFEPKLLIQCRETVDGERETLDSLLFRVDKEHARDRITWEQFLINFCKRGKLREGEQLQFGPPLKSEAEIYEESQRNGIEEDVEDKQYRLMRSLKEKLIGKQNIVPKTGKGKYNVTVPTPFDFLKKSKNEKSIRAMRNEQELARKR
jgi:hypothetical protein